MGWTHAALYDQADEEVNDEALHRRLKGKKSARGTDKKSEN
jgi:hypothetical protein